MKKLILVILVIIIFVLSSFKSYAVGTDTCTGASLCSGTYNIDCNLVADGFCPTYYGDWGSCKFDAYGSICHPCDPDCGIVCSTTLSLDCSPVLVEPSGTVTVTSTATTNVGDELRIYQGQLPSGTPWRTRTCTQTNCQIQDTDGAPSQGGETFYYTATTRDILANEGRYVTTGCITKPLCSININPTVVIDGKKIVRGQVNVDLNVDSTIGVKSKELYFYKWNNRLSQFSKMTPPEQGCSIKGCTFTDCNKLTLSPTANTYVWDTTKCENADYRLTLTGADHNNNQCTASDDATIDSSTICVDQCSIFSSKIINTIIVKIRSWI